MLEKYNPILNAMKDLCPTAHIAGGAVRDTLLERPIKDIDLFLLDDVTDEAAKLMRSQFGYVKTGQWAAYMEFSDPVIARLAKFERADEAVPVCLIGLKCPMDMEKNVNRFDFGVCMAAWDGSNVHTADEYRDDVAGKTFTLYRADNLAQFNYSMSRFNKITADRYEGWRLAIRPGFVRNYTFRSSWLRGIYDPKYDAVGRQELTPKER